MRPCCAGPALLAAALLCVGFVSGGNPDAKRLYDDLLSNYNKLVRPVVNVSEAVTVRLKLKLSQLIDVVSECMRRSSGRAGLDNVVIRFMLWLCVILAPCPPLTPCLSPSAGLS